MWTCQGRKVTKTHVWEQSGSRDLEGRGAGAAVLGKGVSVGALEVGGQGKFPPG